MKYTLGISECIRKIFTAVIVGAIMNNSPILAEKRAVYRVCLPRFLAQFSDNVFQDEYAFLYEMLKTMKIKVFSLHQLNEVVELNQDLILDSPYINMTKWSTTVDNRPTTDSEKIEAFKASLNELVTDLSNSLVSEEEFNSSCEIFIKFYIEQSSLETVQNMALILSETGFLVKKTRKRSVLYKGVDDSNKYYNERQAIIRALSTQDRVVSEVIDSEWLAHDLEQENVEDEDKLLDFGLEEIDSVMGEMRRSNLITVLGPPKGGKTRLTNYLVQRALSKGLNVCVWPLEVTKEDWVANQVACMACVDNGVQLDSKRVLERKYESEQVKEIVIAAKTRLATDYTRGKLSFITGPAYVEDFIDIIRGHYELKNPFDVIVIDQLVNVLSKEGKPKVDRISNAYMSLKDYITNKMPRKALAIIPAQLKQDVVDYLRRNPEDTIDVTAGGESAETIRSADEVIGLFSNKEERASQRMKIYSVASRHSGNFDDFTAHCELGCCYFESDSSLNDAIPNQNV